MRLQATAGADRAHRKALASTADATAATIEARVAFVEGVTMLAMGETAFVAGVGSNGFVDVIGASPRMMLTRCGTASR